MSNKYLIDQKLLDQIKRDHRRTDISVAGNPATYSDNISSRMFARITGRYDGIQGAYKAEEMISDSNFEFDTAKVSAPYTWGESGSESFPPIIDITSLSPYNIQEPTLKRIPDNTIVEVFLRGNIDGVTGWYCEAPENYKPIAFGAEILETDGTEKVRITAGQVYGKDFSTTVASSSFNTSANLWIYVQYTITFSSYSVSVDGLYSTNARPTEITDSSLTRIIKVPLVSFDGDVLMSRHWEGDIYAFTGWFADSDSCLDMLIDSEGPESGLTDTWDRSNQTGKSGVCITMQTRTVYNDAGDEILYGYLRDFHFDGEGKLESISAETRIIIETPEVCI